LDIAHSYPDQTRKNNEENWLQKPAVHKKKNHSLKKTIFLKKLNSSLASFPTLSSAYYFQISFLSVSIYHTGIKFSLRQISLPPNPPHVFKNILKKNPRF